MTMLSLSLMGPFRVTLGNQLVTGFRTVKERALLAYLAVEAHRWHRREALAEMFWPERPDGVGRGDLRQALFGIRRAIREQVTHKREVHILTTRHAVRLNPESEVWIDVAAFHAHLRAARDHNHERLVECPTCMGRLQEAVELYRGDFLEDLVLDDSSDFQEWETVNREQLFRQQLDALRRLTDACQQLGDGEMALRYARRQVDLAPLQESAHRQLMALLAMSGRRTEALEQYRTCIRVLAEELGVEPDVETMALHEQIRAGKLGGKGTRKVPPLPPGAFAPLHNIPAQLTPFIGRETELAQIERLLANPDCRLLSVVGPGGVGKTRLALQAAAEHLEAFPDGVWFVPLAPVHSPDLLVSSIAQEMGVSTEKGQDPRARLLDYLRPRQALLVMDNFEHLLPSSIPPKMEGEDGEDDGGGKLLLEILRHAPGVKILVTSRERLNYQAEFLLNLEGLPYPQDPTGFQSLSGLVDFASVQLFQERASRVRTGFSASEENISPIVHICQLVEGLPLGIELAAAWVQNLTPAEIAQQIQKSLNFLAVSSRDVPRRQRSLRATFEHSWQLLPETGRATYRKLSVFRGTFTLEAAQAVAGASPAVLSALLDKSLLRRSAAGRYVLHPLLRGYALEKLTEIPAEEQERRTRHSHYYLAFVQERENTLVGEHPKDALKEIQADIGNVRAAWEWAVTQGVVEALDQSIAGLAHFYDLMGLLQEGEAVFGDAAERISRTKTHKVGDQRSPETSDVLSGLPGRLLTIQARFLFRLGRYAQTVACSRAAIDLTHAAQDGLYEAMGYLCWGDALRCQGEFVLARTRLEQALSLARGGQPQRSEIRTNPSMQRVEAESLNAIAGVCAWQGDYEGAWAYLERALRLAVHAGDRRGQSRALSNLGVVAVERGDYAKATSYYRQGLRIWQAMGDRQGESITFGNLGNVYLYLGAYAEAKRHYEQALRIQRETGAQQNEALSVGNLGLLYHYLGENETAREYSQRALRIAQEIGEPHAQGAMWMKLGHALSGLGRLDEAAEAYRKSIHLRREMGQTIPATEPLAGLARVALAQGRLNEASEHVKEILGMIGDCENLDGLIAPFQVCLTCFRVLQASEDPRAPEILRHAHRQLQSRAAKISDETLRRSFLENVAANRTLVETWEAARG